MVRTPLGALFVIVHVSGGPSTTEIPAPATNSVLGAVFEIVQFGSPPTTPIPTPAVIVLT